MLLPCPGQARSAPHPARSYPSLCTAAEHCCSTLSEFYGPNSTLPSRNCFCVEDYWKEITKKAGAPSGIAVGQECPASSAAAAAAGHRQRG